MSDATRPRRFPTVPSPGRGPVEPPVEYDWKAQWQDEPAGPCVRCHDPAHTLGPDERPWHAYCWYVPDLPVPSKPTYQGIPLGGSVEQFHAALDQLEQDTLNPDEDGSA